MASQVPLATDKDKKDEVKAVRHVFESCLLFAWKVMERVTSNMLTASVQSLWWLIRLRQGIKAG